MSYNVGDLITVSAVVTNAAGAAVDPAKLQFCYKDPGGNPITGVKGHVGTPYIYGTDTELVKDSTGHYHIDLPIPFDADSEGRWHFHWQALDSSDDETGASEGNFRVIASVFV